MTNPSSSTSRGEFYGNGNTRTHTSKKLKLMLVDHRKEHFFQNNRFQHFLISYLFTDSNSTTYQTLSGVEDRFNRGHISIFASRVYTDHIRWCESLTNRDKSRTQNMLFTNRSNEAACDTVGFKSCHNARLCLAAAT